MILKYIVPENQRWRFNNKKVIYCRITSKKILIGLKNKVLYKVQMINMNNLSNIFLNTDLKRLNLFDLIKILFL